MKKLFHRSYLLISALAIMLVACLTGGTMLLSANAQDEPASTVKLTSYTTVLSVGEKFTFAAEVTLADGTTSDEVTWTSSDDTVISMAENVATAEAEGTATITATAGEVSASVDVLVSDSAIRVEGIELYPDVLELGVGWKTRLDYTILPEDAYEQSVIWASDNPSVITVDENGNVEAIGAGSAVITVTARDTFKKVTATCSVMVYADLEETTITPDTIVMSIGQHDNDEVALTLPDNVTGSDYRWYSMEDAVASVDHYIDNLATIYAWNFGTTTIYGVTHGSDGKVYGAMATVHVTEDYFYISGLESVNAEDPWQTYDTESAAQDAGVLLLPDPNNPYLYSLTRNFWAFDDFQILNNTMQPDGEWTTRITSTSFTEDGSSMDYIANTEDMFRVNALGSYTVTLDLSDGFAKVTIQMVTLDVTSFDLSVAEGSQAYLQYNGPESAENPTAARTMILDVYTIPEAATVVLGDVEVIIPEAYAAAVTAEPRLTDNGKLQIVLTLNEAYTQNEAFRLDVRIRNTLDYATDDITITILADGETYSPVTAISFTSASYLVNVNNGAKPWISSMPLEATVNSDASVSGVVYTENYDEIYIEYIDGLPYVHAIALGTFTIYATSLGSNEEGKTMTTETTVLVTSLIQEEGKEDQSGFYLIGVLNGREVENWTSILPEVTTFGDSEFKNWALALDETQPKIYSITAHFQAYDRFSIAFLGMNINWDGIINAENMDWANSEGTYWESDGNVQFSVDGTYTITLNLSYEKPFFTVELVEEDSTVTYNLYLYIVRGGDSWEAAQSDSDNMLAEVGYIEIVDGVAQSLTLTLEYTFPNNLVWPTIQFVTARGLQSGYFYGATWYGESYKDLVFSGEGYTDTTPPEENRFTNADNNAVLYWTGEYTGATQITTSFTFTFDESGVLTEIAVGAVTVTTTE